MFSHPGKERAARPGPSFLSVTSAMVPTVMLISEREGPHIAMAPNFTSTDSSSHIHIPSKMHIFLAKSSAISPLSGISFLGRVPSLSGDLSASRLSIGVGTFACQNSTFGVPTSKKQFGSKNFPEVLRSQG